MIPEVTPSGADGAEILAFGHPRHGIARDGKLRRLDGVVESYPITLSSGETRIFKIPDLAVPATWPESGRELRNYALLSGERGALYAKHTASIDLPVWIYRDAASGQRWLVMVTAPTPGASISAGATSLSVTVVFRRLGELDAGTITTVTRTHSITDGVFGNDLATVQGGIFYGGVILADRDILDYRMRFEDATRTGDKACFSFTHKWDAFSAQTVPSWYSQRFVVALAEMTIAIAESDGLPDFTLANAHPRSTCLPVSTYTGPVDGTYDCPFGTGSRRYDIEDRIIGAVYSNTGTLAPVKASWSWESAVAENIKTYSWDGLPPAPAYDNTVTATSSCDITLAIAAESVTVSATASRTASHEGTLDSADMPQSHTSGFGADSITIDRPGSTVFPCVPMGGTTYECRIAVDVSALNYIVQPRCITYLGNPDDGEWPHGLSGPISSAGEDSTLGVAFVHRFSANLWGVLHKKTSALWLDALLGPGGPITSFLKVESCTVGAEDPDCLFGGYKYVTAALGSLGDVDATNLRGSHNTETLETIISTDGISVCFV